MATESESPGGGMTVAAGKVSVRAQRLPAQPVGWPKHNKTFYESAQAPAVGALASPFDAAGRRDLAREGR